MSAPGPWSLVIPWPRAGDPARRLQIEADADTRRAIAARLGLEGLTRLAADLVVRRCMDGLEVGGRLEAIAERLCGISLERFEETVSETVETRFLPPGSAGLPSAGQEVVVVDLEAQDPPEVGLEAGVDLAALLVELLGVGLDPFPRAPGASFEPPALTQDASPFAALAALRRPPGEGEET